MLERIFNILEFKISKRNLNKYEVIVDMFYKCSIIHFNLKYDGLENDLTKK